MLPIKLQIILILMTMFFFLVLLHFLRRKKLALRYSLLWLLFWLIMVLLAIFPDLIVWFSEIIGFAVASNALFVVLFVFILLIMIHLTVIVSDFNQKMKVMSQKVALTEFRLRKAEEEIECIKSSSIDDKEPIIKGINQGNSMLIENSLSYNTCKEDSKNR